MSAPTHARPDPKPVACFIEVIVTCVNYADFLTVTLPYNRIHFDALRVVTAPEDRATQEVCRFHHVQCIVTDEFGSHWGKFRKGFGINAGIAASSKSDWLVQLDADVLLPGGFRHVIDVADLDKSFIYGIDRLCARTFEDWQRFIQAPVSQKQGDAFVHPRAFDIGHRLCIPDWMPIGFFQMWNPSVSGVATYPTSDVGADHTDVVFASNWPRRSRALIPELYAYHLESENLGHGANWSGRKTKPFGI